MVARHLGDHHDAGKDRAGRRTDHGGHAGNRKDRDANVEAGRVELERTVSVEHLGRRARVVLQAVEDTQVNQRYPDRNWGTRATMFVDGGASEMGDGDKTLTYLKFRLDLPGKPIAARLRLHNGGNPNLAYVDSTYGVAHDNGLNTALYASKSKFVLFDRSYDADNGAADLTGADDGTDKIDTYVNKSTGTPPNASNMHADFLADMAANRFNYVWVNYRDPDSAGHASGWGSSTWDESIKDVDDYLGDILALIEGDPMLDGKTVVIVTGDHGGSATGHSVASNPANYTIPFLVWGNDIPGGTDLYALNAATRLDPGTGRPDYAAAVQPIRSGDAGNLALSLLGLPALAGSTVNGSQDLVASVSGPSAQVPTTTASGLHARSAGVGLGEHPFAGTASEIQHLPR